MSPLVINGKVISGDNRILSSNSSGSGGADGFLLMETGDYLILETGDRILLE
jgi:hypothetical protein